MTLGIDTRIVIAGAGLIFLLALVLGIWKYRQMATSDNHLAHPYVDTAHRAALLYSFATMLIAVWPTWVGPSPWSAPPLLLRRNATQRTEPSNDDAFGAPLTFFVGPTTRAVKRSCCECRQRMIVG